MCLILNEKSRKLTAKEDIVCYKTIDKRNSILPKEEYHGKPFKAFINKQEVSGVISIEYGSMYLCNDIANGANCENKFGYRYSWYLDDKVTNLKIDGKLIKKSTYYCTPYYKMIIKLRETYKTKLVKEDDKVRSGFHSFIDKDSCKSSCGGNILVECIIPKGSKYYIGMFNNENDNYASDTIKYIKILK